MYTNALSLVTVCLVPETVFFPVHYQIYHRAGFFCAFLKESKWIICVFSNTHRISWFFFRVNVISLRYFGSVVSFFDIARSSVISPTELRVMYTDSSLVSTETVYFRLDYFVPGIRPKCISNGVFFVLGVKTVDIQCFI